MGDWQLKTTDLKFYPHFDAVISLAEANALVKSPERVAAHTFYPFMLYLMRWTRFAKQGEVGTSKEREIRYAARADAYIYAYYRHILSTQYEKELQKASLTGSVLAYRRIPTHTGGGKCNIHFALEAVEKIREIGNCCAIALDISKFFESLDHERLKLLWCRMLGANRLPDDHFKVYEAITRYAVVDKKAVYERLGHFGPKRMTKNGKIISGYLTPHADLPKQLCTGKTFRDKIAGGDGTPTLIKTHYKPYGIPQGAPISDLLANLYLLDFDTELASIVSAKKGAYFRYSDDILIVVPGDAAQGIALEEMARKLISKFGSKLQIKEEKSSVVMFQSEETRQSFASIKGASRTGLEYLGFRYDGNKIYIRNSTIQNLYRKITYAARREAMSLAKRYPNRSAEELRSQFNYEKFVAKFGRVEDFDELHDDYRKWTFWTYAQRAAEVMGSLGLPIKNQLKRHRNIIRAKLDAEFERAVARRKD